MHQNLHIIGCQFVLLTLSQIGSICIKTSLYTCIKYSVLFQSVHSRTTFVKTELITISCCLVYSVLYNILFSEVLSRNTGGLEFSEVLSRNTGGLKFSETLLWIKKRGVHLSFYKLQVKIRFCKETWICAFVPRNE